jgi:hypothetical protein
MIELTIGLFAAAFVWGTQYDADRTRLTGRPHLSRLTVITGALSLATVAVGFAV